MVIEWLWKYDLRKMAHDTNKLSKNYEMLFLTNTDKLIFIPPPNPINGCLISFTNLPIREFIISFNLLNLHFSSRNNDGPLI